MAYDLLNLMDIWQALSICIRFLSHLKIYKISHNIADNSASLVQFHQFILLSLLTNFSPSFS